MLNKIKDFVFFKIGSIAGYVYASILALIIFTGIFYWITESLFSFLMFEIICLACFVTFGFYTLLVTDILIVVFLIYRKKLQHKEVSKTKNIMNITMFIFYIVISLGLKSIILFAELCPKQFLTVMNFLNGAMYTLGQNIPL